MGHLLPCGAHATDEIKALRQYEGVLAKLLEVTRESIWQKINNRKYDISELGAKALAKATCGRKPELLAHFEQTIEYRSQIAEKAAATRRKNEADTEAAKSPAE